MVEVLSRRTSAPTFPRLKLSTTKLRPGGGRWLAITFRLKHTSRVVLTFRTTKGKIVRRIRTPRRYKAGTVLRLRWDGRDSKGRYVKPGRYGFTVTAAGSHYQKTARGIGARSRCDDLTLGRPRIATTRAGAALPPTIRSGKQATVKPVGGSAPRLASRSICE